MIGDFRLLIEGKLEEQGDKDLFGNTTASPNNQQSQIKNLKFLVLDTAFFSSDFKARLIASIEDFDEQCDGLLIHSENFQALNLLQERYREQVKCVYIDPPYNTGNDGFFYKDSYQRSSWLTMIYERIISSMHLFNENGSLFASIDDNEVGSLTSLINDIFGKGLHVTNIAARINPRGRTLDKYLAKNHEYITAFSLFSGDDSIVEIPKGEKALNEYRYKDEIGKFRALELRNRNPVFNRANRPNLYYPIYTRDSGGEVSLEKTEDFTIEIFPVNSKGEDGCWTWGREKLQNEKSDVFAKLASTGAWRVFRKDRVDQGALPTTKEKSIWLDKEINNENGKELIGHMFGKVEVSFPKATGLIEKVVRIGAGTQGYILDYFAGSGTTGHAVINLNREDNGKRKYILVEMGDYFDTVTKPRIAKVIYSSEWKIGKPTSRDKGISHCFKYIRLESYEDTLNNLVFDDNPVRNKAIESNPSLKEDYMLRYLLNVETRGSQSLLNIDAFADPTAYALVLKRPGSDEQVKQHIDLIETFNYLLGLRLENMAAPQTFTASFTRKPDPELPEDQHTKLVVDGKIKQIQNPDSSITNQQSQIKNPVWWFRKLEGWVPADPMNPNNGQKERVLIVWRKLTGNLEEDNLMLDEWFEKYRISTRDFEYDTIYVNGSNNLPNLKKDDENWKVRLIEEEFHKKMWEMGE